MDREITQTEREGLTTDRKALLINLDQKVFGTFAEIGAGQEVARHFFRVGGAAGTIAKTMSAYDMTFSDEIYGNVAPILHSLYSQIPFPPEISVAQTSVTVGWELDSKVSRLGQQTISLSMFE